MNDKFITLLTDSQRSINSYIIRRGRGSLKKISKIKSSDCLLTSKQQINDLNLDVYSEVVCEIGFGMGDSLFKQALNNPSALYIGIEVHLDGVLQLSNNINENKCNNLKIIYGDACYILSSLVPNNIFDCIQLYFPDPWPKSKHHKRRIIRLQLLDAINLSLKPLGLLHMCTDWEPYADEMLEVINDCEAYCLFEHSVNDPKRGRVETKYERRGMKLGHNIHDILVKKRTH
jgi:tRNA (guanine-N7-)-methyltransferase